MRIPGTTASDRQLLRRASWRGVALTAAAVAIVVVIVAVLSYLLAGRELSRRNEQLVQNAAVNADDVGDPPSGVILIFDDGHTVRRSADTPTTLDSIRPSDMDVGPRTVDTGDHEYVGYVSERADGSRFLALLTPEQQVEPTRLLAPVLLAGAAGMVAAAVVGGLLGRRSVQPLGRALELQRNFVADASHELRTPLTVLHTRAQLIQRDLRGDENPELADEVGHLVADTRVLEEVVHDLLLSAELEYRPSRSEPVDMGEIAEHIAATFSSRAQQLGVGLQARVEPTDGPVVVAGARSALQRALSALVDNALGHTAPGGHVRIHVSRVDRSVVTAVIDDGEGLDPGQAEMLMQRFARGHRTDGSGRRFGLGLALVQQVIQAHRGTLQVEGRPGAGATFTIRLPAGG